MTMENSAGAMNGRSPGLHPAFPDAVVIVDDQGAILQANARAVALFGSVEGLLSGTTIHDLFPGQHVPFSSGGWLRRMHADRFAELTACRGDGSKFRAAVAVIPMQTDGGATAVITIRDLTEARETQFILEQGLELLRTVISDLPGSPRRPGGGG
jgi:PAS domain S-box-containing protein